MKPRPVAIEFDHRFTPNLVMVFHNCSDNSCSYRALSPINSEGPGEDGLIHNEEWLCDTYLTAS